MTQDDSFDRGDGTSHAFARRISLIGSEVRATLATPALTFTLVFLLAAVGAEATIVGMAAAEIGELTVSPRWVAENPALLPVFAAAVFGPVEPHRFRKFRRDPDRHPLYGHAVAGRGQVLALAEATDPAAWWARCRLAVLAVPAALYFRHCGLAVPAAGALAAALWVAPDVCRAASAPSRHRYLRLSGFLR